MYSLGLIGYPLTYSLSPALHKAALRACGLAGEYHCYPVPPLPDGERALADLLARLRRGELQGLNVTIPHKEIVLPHLDSLSPEAEAIGAANTIAASDGRLTGYNTDAGGFLADLDRLGWFPKRGRSRLGEDPAPRALVLGAGGAARAVAYALSGLGWAVYVAARRFEAARQLADSLRRADPSGLTHPARLKPLELNAAGLRQAPAVSLIVNATPVGMHPNGEASPWPEGLALPAGAAVYDLVYQPAETDMLKAARAAGLPVANGTGMLVEQAALAFQIWTGCRAPLEAMRQALTEGKQSFTPKRTHE